MAQQMENANKEKPKRRASPSRGRPRAMAAADLERKLLAAALQEFLLHGYRGASLTRIVESAGISKTTLYSRYPAKKALFRAMLNEQIERSKPSESLHSDLGPLSLAEGLTRYADDMLKFALQQEVLGVERLLCSESHHFPELAVAAAERNQLGVKRIAGFIEQSAKQEGIPCRDAKSIAEIFIAAIRGWYVDVLVANRDVTAAERLRWVRTTVETLLAGRTGW